MHSTCELRNLVTHIIFSAFSFSLSCVGVSAASAPNQLALFFNSSHFKIEFVCLVLYFVFYSEALVHLACKVEELGDTGQEGRNYER